MPSSSQVDHPPWNQDPQPKATANAAMENAEKAQRNSTCPVVSAPEQLLSSYNPRKMDTSPIGIGEKPLGPI